MITQRLNIRSVLVVALLCGCSKSEPTQAEKESRYIFHHQQQIKSRLKDANSAQFRNVFVSRRLDMPIVCGEVNAKNSFGGYSGFQRFISGGSIQVLESDIVPSEMENTWLQICGRPPHPR